MPVVINSTGICFPIAEIWPTGRGGGGWGWGYCIWIICTYWHRLDFDKLRNNWLLISVNCHTEDKETP